MTPLAALTRTAWCLIAAAGLAGAAAACPIEAVIDWHLPPTKPFLQHQGTAGGVLHWIHQDKWDLELDCRTRIRDYAAWDGDIFAPKDDHKFGDPVRIKVLAGAAVGDSRHIGDPPDWISIWSWVDANNNFRADEYDNVLVGGKSKEQNWRLVYHGPPEACDEVINVFHGVPDDNRTFVPGLSYILLIKAGSNGRRTSWDWENGVFFQLDELIYLDSATYATSKPEWSATLKPNKYMGVAGGERRGIDDYEVLWIRINQPPGGPGRHTVP